MINIHKKITWLVVMLICSVSLQASLPAAASAVIGIAGTQIMIYSELGSNQIKYNQFKRDLISQNQHEKLTVLNRYEKNISRAVATSALLNVSFDFCAGVAAGVLCFGDNSSLVANAMITGTALLGSSAALAYAHNKLIDHAIKKTYEVPEIQQV